MSYQPRRREFQIEPAWSSRAFAIGLVWGSMLGMVTTVLTQVVAVNWSAFCSAIQ